MLVSTFYTPPAPLGAAFAFMDQSREGREFWRTMQMSSHDVLASYFEHDRVRAHFARVAGENLVSPDEKSTGLGLFVFLGFLEAYGFGVPVGGSGKLTEALVRCIEHYGGSVLMGQEVREVIVRDGRAAGVVTGDDRTHLAREAVIGAIHPHKLGSMVAGLDPEVRNAGGGDRDQRGGVRDDPRRARCSAALPDAAAGAVGDDRAHAGELSRAARML